MKYIPRIRRRRLDPYEAAALNLDQPARVHWTVVEFVWWRWGFVIAAKAEPA